jgi:GMP synthase (glutamine-hydrolysing)
MQHQKLLIVDFGSQVTQLIARRVRELAVYCEIHPYQNVNAAFLNSFGPHAIILSGGPASVNDDDAPMLEEEFWQTTCPILGICYGQQLLGIRDGGIVDSSCEREFGPAEVGIVQESPLFHGLWERAKFYPVWMSHGDRIAKLPDGYTILASSKGAPCAIMANEKQKRYGVQFHPEVTHTPDGKALLKNFLYNVCEFSGDWSIGSFIDESIEKIQKIVGKKTVVCAVSGGVDSTVVAALLHRALGKQLHAIFVNTGLLRKNEPEYVQHLYANLLKIPLQYVDASEIFLKSLAGISDPEQKRKIIGGLFIDVFEAETKDLQDAEFLAQGTLYPDVIESVSVHGNASSTIKSHHNVGGLPERMRMKLIEPVRELFKDEVRSLGHALGVPEQMIARHPFPGPGLAIRIPGEITAEKVTLLQNADEIYLEEIRAAGLYDKIWQAFAVLLPVKTVGVMGDARTYEYVCALRAVTSTDGMTADYFDFPHSFLRSVSTRIINQVRGINRVVYDITPKPPGTIEWE